MLTTSPSRNGMRHPQDSSAAVGIIAAKPAPTAEPSRMPPHAPHDVNAPIRPRRPSGARSTRNTIELVYSPPTERPWTMRSKVSAMAARSPSVAYPGSSPIRKVGIAMAANRQGQRGAPPEPVADMADQRAADRPHQIAERKHAERRKQLGYRILMREELAADCRRDIGVDRKFVHT